MTIGSGSQLGTNPLGLSSNVVEEFRLQFGIKLYLQSTVEKNSPARVSLDNFIKQSTEDEHIPEVGIARQWKRQEKK
jgi:hypothetical protein